MACVQLKNNESQSQLTFKVEIEDLSELDKTVEILQKRLTSFCSNAEINQYGNSKILEIKLPGTSDTTLFTKLITTKAKFQILETFENRDLINNLQKINALMLDMDLADSVKNDSLSNNYPFFKILLPMVDQNGIVSPGPGLGTSSANDTQQVKEVLSTTAVKTALPNDFIPVWGNSFYGNDYFTLYAVKKSNQQRIISNFMVEETSVSESTNNSYAVNILFKNKYHKDWGKLTENNISRALAIVFDHYVYSAPQVMAKISGGKSQIAGNFNELEANLLATFIGSGFLTSKLTIKSIKHTSQ